MALNGMAKNILHLPVWRPEQDSNLRPTAWEANPNQARQRPPSPDMALTCNHNRLTTSDTARLLLTLAPSLALGRSLAPLSSRYGPAEFPRLTCRA